jgi:hypothetical protein
MAEHKGTLLLPNGDHISAILRTHPSVPTSSTHFANLECQTSSTKESILGDGIVQDGKGRRIALLIHGLFGKFLSSMPFLKASLLSVVANGYHFKSVQGLFMSAIARSASSSWCFLNQNNDMLPRNMIQHVTNPPMLNC